VKTLPRVAIALLAFVLALVLEPSSIDWSSIRWGTAPEWIAALALLLIAAGVWRIAVMSERRDHAGRNENADLSSR
jgi:hypothetical protein